MQPFVSPQTQLAAALGNANPALIGKFNSINNVQLSTQGTLHYSRGFNSFGLVSANGFRGQVEGGYNRINITKLMGAPGKKDTVIRSRSKPTSTHAAMDLMLRKWKFEFNKDSILDLPVVYDGQGVGTVTVTFKDGAIEAYGTFQFKIAPGPDSIADLQINTNLGDGLYPSGRTDKGQAQFLSYPADASGESAYFGSIFTGYPIDQLLIDKVSAITGIGWIMSPGQYSLAGAKVTYVGPVRPGLDLVKDPYSQICTILLSDSCENFAGELVFYYNPN